MSGELAQKMGGLFQPSSELKPLFNLGLALGGNSWPRKATAALAPFWGRFLAGLAVGFLAAGSLMIGGPAGVFLFLFWHWG